MSKRRGSPTKWIIVIFFSIGIFLYWRQLDQRTASPISEQSLRVASPETNLQQPVSVEISQGREILTNPSVENVAIVTENVSKQEESSSLSPVNQSSLNQGQSPTGSVDSGLSKPPVVEFIPTDEQALVAINLQNQQRQQLSQVLIDRQNRIQQVHDAIKAEQAQDSADGQVKPFVAPKLVAPEEVMRKVKSHEAVVH
ncbi:MAG: hypothetical protein WCH62_01385 [Candidatus Omnitrophota bacterium]